MLLIRPTLNNKSGQDDGLKITHLLSDKEVGFRNLPTSYVLPNTSIGIRLTPHVLKLFDVPIVYPGPGKALTALFTIKKGFTEKSVNPLKHTGVPNRTRTTLRKL